MTISTFSHCDFLSVPVRASRGASLRGPTWWWWPSPTETWWCRPGGSRLSTPALSSCSGDSPSPGTPRSGQRSFDHRTLPSTRRKKSWKWTSIIIYFLTSWYIWRFLLLSIWTKYYLPFFFFWGGGASFFFLRVWDIFSPLNAFMFIQEHFVSKSFIGYCTWFSRKCCCFQPADVIKTKQKPKHVPSPHVWTVILSVAKLICWCRFSLTKSDFLCLRQSQITSL